MPILRQSSINLLLTQSPWFEAPVTKMGLDSLAQRFELLHGVSQA